MSQKAVVLIILFFLGMALIVNGVIKNSPKSHRHHTVSFAPTEGSYNLFLPIGDTFTVKKPNETLRLIVIKGGYDTIYHKVN